MNKMKPFSAIMNTNTIIAEWLSSLFFQWGNLRQEVNIITVKFYRNYIYIKSQQLKITTRKKIKCNNHICKHQFEDVRHNLLASLF